MENSHQGLTEWEWNFIRHVKPEMIRKRFREELDYLSTVGGLLEMIKDNLLLAHVLAFAWKSTYHIALVCKRFHFVTKSRAYWAALAKHAFEKKVPANILKEINFFNRLADNEPSHTYLQGLLKADLRHILYKENEIILFYLSDSFKTEKCFRIEWLIGKRQRYMIEHYSVSARGGLLYNSQHYCEFFNYERSRKLIWINDIEKGTIYLYCEVFDPQRGQTWYGEPGTLDGPTQTFIEADEMMPTSQSWGVWK